MYVRGRTTALYIHGTYMIQTCLYTFMPGGQDSRCRPFRTAGDADHDGDGSGDARDKMARMMGDGDQTVAPGGAQDPSRYPGHCNGVSRLNFVWRKYHNPSHWHASDPCEQKNKVCIKCA